LPLREAEGRCGETGYGRRDCRRGSPQMTPASFAPIQVAAATPWAGEAYGKNACRRFFPECGHHIHCENRGVAAPKRIRLSRRATGDKLRSFPCAGDRRFSRTVLSDSGKKAARAAEEHAIVGRQPNSNRGNAWSHRSLRFAGADFGGARASGRNFRGDDVGADGNYFFCAARELLRWCRRRWRAGLLFAVSEPRVVSTREAAAGAIFGCERNTCDAGVVEETGGRGAGRALARTVGP